MSEGWTWLMVAKHVGAVAQVTENGYRKKTSQPSLDTLTGKWYPKPRGERFLAVFLDSQKRREQAIALCRAVSYRSTALSDCVVQCIAVCSVYHVSPTASNKLQLVFFTCLGLQQLLEAWTPA